MSLPSLQARRRNVRPVVDGLESRELLSAAPTVAAQVSMISGQEMSQESIVGQLSLPPTKMPSTVPQAPAPADTNPYGVAFVPSDFPKGGRLHPGDVLVSNFNNSLADGSVQGTGTTIVRITPQGQQSVFFTSTEPGLSTALGVLKDGFVIVGNVPTTDGTFNTIQQGSLQVIDRFGNQVLKLTDPNLLDGPWDLTINDLGPIAQVFVSNVISGTVTRIDLLVLPSLDKVKVLDMTQIASGYTVSPNGPAVVLGPTGLAFDPRTDTLYVASTGDNAIYAIRNAALTFSDGGKGKLIFNDAAHLNGPLGLVLAPNGDLITTNGDAFNLINSSVPPSELVEFTPTGQFVAEFSIEPNNSGSAFGIALGRSGNHLILAAVDDFSNQLDLFQVNG